MTKDFNALTLSHRLFREHVSPGSICIDATAGRGRDTELFCQLVGEQGKVLAFDIQQEALDSTRALLEEKGVLQRAQLILDSHEHMHLYAKPGSVDCIAFNLGWLPGGSHQIFTRPQSSIAAIESGLKLLRVGGVMSICIYYGRDCGFEERDTLLAYLPTIDSQKFTVLLQQFCNRPNNPPIPVFIYKDCE